MSRPFTRTEILRGVHKSALIRTTCLCGKCTICKHRIYVRDLRAEKKLEKTIQFSKENYGPDSTNLGSSLLRFQFYPTLGKRIYPKVFEI